MDSKGCKVKLSDIGTIVGGATPSTNCLDNYGGDIPWITPKDLSGYRYKYISSGSKNITDKGLKSCSARIMPRDSILFTSRAPIGYMAIAANDICTNQGFKSIIPNHDVVYSEFLYYKLKSEVESIKDLGTGTTFPEISGKVFGEYQIDLPSLQIQKKIVKILCSIDSVIEKNMKVNDYLAA